MLLYQQKTKETEAQKKWDSIENFEREKMHIFWLLESLFVVSLSWNLERVLEWGRGHSPNVSMFLKIDVFDLLLRLWFKSSKKF